MDNPTERLNRLGLVRSDMEEQLPKEFGALHTARKIMNHSAIRWMVHWQYAEYDATPEDPFWKRMRADHPNMRIDEFLGRFFRPVRVNAFDGNLLTTVGAGDLWNGLVTAGLATPFNSTNAQIALGDSATAAAAGQTDMQAAVGTKLNAADVTSASNATPIVVAGTYSPVPLVGDVVVFSAFGGAGAAALNQTFELSAASGSSITPLNSAGTGAITVAGGLVKPINYYRQLVNGAPTVTTNSVAFVSLFGANNANWHAQEFGICTGGAATNKLSQAPPHLLDRVVADNGTKARGNTGTMTATLSLA